MQFEVPLLVEPDVTMLFLYVATDLVLHRTRSKQDTVFGREFLKFQSSEVARARK